MKKLTLLCLFFASFAIHKAHAQPTFYIDLAEQTVDPGDQVCFTVRFRDFTNIIGVSFTLQYDPGVIEYVGVTPASMAGLPGLTTDNVQNPEPGIITFEWDDGQPCQSAVNGPTLPDFEQLFELCFIATGIYGNHTPICFTDDPVDQVVQRSSSNCQDIGEFTSCGYISIGTESLRVNISSADGFQGDVVCLDFEVENFDCIISFQNSVLWDETVLQYISATPSNLQEFTAANIGTTQVDQGVLNLSWWTTGGGVSLPDGTQVLEVCFEIVGETGDNSTVSVGPNPLGSPIEVVDCTSGSTSAGTNIGMLQTEGVVTVNGFDEDAITVNVEDKQICPGESFTVDVTVEDFDNITDLLFTLKWNPSVINLTNTSGDGVSFPDGEPCFLFDGPSIDVNPAQGTIEVDWNTTSFGCNVDDNDRLMRLHFTAVGSSGTNTTVSIINPINVEQFGGGDNIGINNNNGFIEICELESPTIIASSATLDAGEQVCVDFTVQDFEDILRTQYTINWESNILQYVGAQSFNLPNLGSFNFLDTQTGQGFIGVEWENATPVSVPDGTVIFELCFEVIGDPDECSPIEFAEVPWAVDVITEESGGTNVGLNGVSGQVCVENPLDLFMDISEAFGSPGAEVCLDVTAEGFTQITELDYSINWNTTILEFARIEETGNLPNFSDASYDDSPGLVDDGQLVVNWLSNNTLQGTTLADGTVLYRICFTVIGEDGECAGVSISGIPELIDVKTAPTGNANLGMEYAPGEVCVNATISLLSPAVVDVDCPTVPSGSIDLTVMGGSGAYVFEWSGFNVIPNAEDQSGLFAGTYFVTVTDESNPALVDEMEITVGLEPNAPIADAGLDTSLNCLSQGLILDGTGSSVGNDLIYFWEAAGPVGSVNPETDSTMNAEIFGPGQYILIVTDENTGCQDIDTVEVAQAVIAVPEIQAMSEMLTCDVDTLTLDGGSSAFGFDILWETSDGAIVPGMENNLMPMVTEPGMYILSFSNPETSCVRADTIMVEQDIEEPTAEAGDLATLGCQDDEVTVDGTGSSTGAEFIYEWTPTGIGEICGDETALNTTACAAGEYQILVTNTVNGCTAVDVVMVEADTSKPTADAGPNLFLDCLVDMVTLDGSGSSQGTQYEYTWFDQMNTQVGTGLTFDATMEGTYTLEVMNNDNDCSAISEVVVEDIAEEFSISAEATNAITCGVDTSLLVWGNTPTDPEYSHTWIAPDGTTPIGSTDSITVMAPGVYTLEVLNSENQCVETIEVEVANETLPPAIFAGDDEPLGCVDFITLAGDNLGNDNLIYQWSGPGVGCITNGTTLNPEIECPGEYILQAVDTVSQCTNSDTLMVIDDAQLPDVAIEPLNSNNSFPCNATELTLTASTDVVDGSIIWTSVPVVPITGETTLTPTISNSAVYTLTVTAANGCSSDSTIAISPATPPLADAGMGGEVDCLNTEFNLSAANSDLDGTTIIWVALVGDDPANPNDVEVTVGAGTYQVTVIDDETGCSSMAQVEVVNNAILPDVEAGNNVEKECDEDFALLLGTADTDLTLTWTDETGSILGNNLQLQAVNEGTYYLNVFDANSNCENQDSVTVTFSISADPADAVADHGPCEAEAMLMGNLPEGATGEWQALTGGSIDSPNDETALASGFAQGENQFVWVLSLGTCVDYSADTVTIVVDESVPVAEDDFVTLDAQSGGVVELGILENDLFDPTVTTFALLDNQNFVGSAELAEDGTLTFTKEKCFSGAVEVEYELCNSTCPDLCDRALVNIDVLLDETENCEDVPNAITPNGDGVNDELVFDLILSNPDFPDNEIIIFNRWGDIVFEAKPYLNDWRGTNGSGKDLPHGTYYYILKLDIARGDIIRGDVTILK